MKEKINMMEICLGTDHAGFGRKEAVKLALSERGFNVIDCGALEYDKDDDYTKYIPKVAEKVSKNPESCRGIVFGGSGEGEAMLANKYKGVRCALFYSTAVPVQAADVTGRESTDPYEIVGLTREHNDANMLSIGERFVTEDQAIEATILWLEGSFSGEKRHARRVEEIKRIENENFK